MNMRSALFSVFLCIPAIVSAQISVSFDTEDYSSIGVYDTWEESPFRTGVLEGNVAVVDNFLRDQINPSSRILALQRSRFGSNTFGAMVRLKETFELTPQLKYVNLMVHRPYGGRVMVIGLGKRRDRKAQSDMTEQFWAISRADVPAGNWQWLSLPVRGNGGIDIYSLVIVPDCESPHAYKEDGICYADNISVTEVPVGEVMKKTESVSLAPGLCILNTANRNGEVTSADGQKLENLLAAEGVGFELSVVPAPGFYCDGVIIHIGGRQLRVTAGKDGRYVIPASEMTGSVFVEGIFVEDR